MDTVHRGRIVVIARDLAGEMIDKRRVLHRCRDVFPAGHRPFGRLDPGVLHPCRDARSHYAKILLTRVEQLPDDVRTEKPRPPVISVFF